MLKSKVPFESKTFKRIYLMGTVVVLVGMWAGSALILSGTPYFAQILPVVSRSRFPLSFLLVFALSLPFWK